VKKGDVDKIEELKGVKRVRTPEEITDFASRRTAYITQTKLLSTKGNLQTMRLILNILLVEIKLRFLTPY
jgi:hypothetical protein